MVTILILNLQVRLADIFCLGFWGSGPRPFFLRRDGGAIAL